MDFHTKVLRTIAKVGYLFLIPFVFAFLPMSITIYFMVKGDNIAKLRTGEVLSIVVIMSLINTGWVLLLTDIF